MFIVTFSKIVSVCSYLNNLFIYIYYLSLCIVYINFSMFSFIYLFVYANVYFLYINIWFVFFLFSYSHLHLYIYICIFNYINYIFIQNSEEIAPNKSMKLRVGWKNLCMLNNFKESNKIVCEVGVNILNY